MTTNYHFNIKVLRGYGVSISLRNNKVCLRNGTDIFTGEAEKEEWFVTEIPYERIMISGKGYVSTEAIKLLTEKNINIVLTDTYGNLVTAMHKETSSYHATNYRMGQYDTFREPAKVEYLQKQVLMAKLDTQIRFLASLQKPELREHIAFITKERKLISEARDKRDLLTIESRCGRTYFKAYSSLFDPKYGFVSRRGGGIKNTNRDASDIINALLNYGYSVLAGEISKYVNGLGLDPYFGFFHTSHISFQSLVYDMIEPFRWLVEYAVFKIVSEPNTRHRIRKSEFVWTREGKIILDSGLIKRFLELLERKMQAERPYSFKHGQKRRDGKMMCQELTIAKICVQNLANFCVEKQNRLVSALF